MSRQISRLMSALLIIISASTCDKPAPTENEWSITITPSVAVVPVGQTQAFVATTTGSIESSKVNWSIESGAGTINKTTGLYTAPSETTDAPDTTIIKASIENSPDKYETATVTIPLGDMQIIMKYPADGSIYEIGDVVTFQGSAVDGNGSAVAEMVWKSSVDGELDRGNFFYRYNLSIATHTITLVATGTNGISDSTQVSIRIKGLPGVSRDVYDILIEGTTVYVVGWFFEAGGLPARGLASWNGTEWSALINDVDGAIENIIRYNGDIYIGGPFSSIDGVAANSVARYDGSAWQPLGNGLTLSNNPNKANVYAMEIFQGKIVVGGDFYSAGDLESTHIAFWDGTSWSGLGGGVTSTVHDILPVGESLYVGASSGFMGSSTFPNAASINYFGKWDGSVWSSVGSSGLSDTYAFCCGGTIRTLEKSGNYIYLGAYGVAFGEDFSSADLDLGRWNISAGAWEPGMGDAAGNLNVMTVQDGMLYVGGNYSTIGGTSAQAIAKWDGSNWSAVFSDITGSISGPPTIRAITFALNGDMYIGGRFTEVEGITVNNIARWDGTQWHALGGD